MGSYRDAQQKRSSCPQKLHRKLQLDTREKIFTMKMASTGTGCLGSSLELYKNFSFSRPHSLKLPLL